MRHPEVMGLTDEDRKVALRKAANAANNAVFAGCTPEQVREAIEEGIREGMANPLRHYNVPTAA